MIRRAVMVAAAAVALIVAPAAAMAQAAAPQAAAGSGFPVVDSSPAGVPFTVRASGARANESVTLTITRRPASNGSHPRSLTQSANASGVVEFAVTIAEDGTYTLVSTSASGSTLSRQSVTVVDQGTVIVAGEGAAASSTGPAPAGSNAGSAPAAAPRAGDRLASTGLPGLGLAGGGGVLVLAGAGLVKAGRRRQVAQASG